MGQDFIIPDKMDVTFCGEELGEVDMTVPVVKKGSIPVFPAEGWVGAPKVLYDMIDAPEQRDAAGQPYKRYMEVDCYCTEPPKKLGLVEFKKMCDFLGIKYEERIIEE